MSVEPALASFIERMPKVELHVHLEGAVRPATLLELARRHRVDLPARDEAGLRSWMRFADFAEFVDIYLTCSGCVRHPEDFQRLALDFCEDQARQRVLYTEAHFTISTHINQGANRGEVAAALAEALDEGRRRHGVEVKLITDIVRNVGVRSADDTIEWALDHRDMVVALGLSGFESEPDEPYREHFRAAAQEGLRRVAHAGEHGGPDKIRSALTVAGAERIGHGVRAVEDPSLVAELAARGVPLEVCPTSNVLLGVAPDLPAHPFARLMREGVEVTVNSDDPGFFDTDLTREYLAVADTFGLGCEEIARLNLAALRHAFLAPAERERLEKTFRRELGELAEELVGQRLTLA